MEGGDAAGAPLQVALGATIGCSGGGWFAGKEPVRQAPVRVPAQGGTRIAADKRVAREGEKISTTYSGTAPKPFPLAVIAR